MGSYPGGMAHTTIHQAVSAFYRDPHAGPRTEQSRVKYRSTLSRFATEAEDFKPIAEVTHDDVYQFLRGVEVAASTRRTYMNRLDSFFKWAIAHQLLHGNPMDGMRDKFPAKVKPVKRHHWLTANQVREIYAAVVQDSVHETLAQRDLLILKLGFTMGLRRQEIAQARFSDIDWDRQSLQLIGKGDKISEVWIPGKTMNALGNWHVGYYADSQSRERIEDDTIVAPILMTHDVVAGIGSTQCRVQWGREISLSAISVAVKRASHSSGIDFSPHDMRRTYAGLLQANGESIETISKALRHSDFGVTQRYLQSRQDAAYQAVQGIDLEI